MLMFIAEWKSLSRYLVKDTDISIALLTNSHFITITFVIKSLSVDIPHDIPHGVCGWHSTNF